MSSAVEIACIVLFIVFYIVGMVFAYHIHLVSIHIRMHHPQIVEEIKGLSIGPRLRWMLDSMVFPHRRLKAELAGEGIKDPKLEALISSTVFWNRLTMVLFALLVLCVVHRRWDDWT